MEPKGQFVFFLLAFICFLVAALWNGFVNAPAGRRWYGGVDVVALGLAFFDFVFLYNAWKTI